jgi:hypothetical protein
MKDIAHKGTKFIAFCGVLLTPFFNTPAQAQKEKPCGATKISSQTISPQSLTTNAERCNGILSKSSDSFLDVETLLDTTSDGVLYPIDSAVNGFIPMSHLQKVYNEFTGLSQKLNKKNPKLYLMNTADVQGKFVTEDQKEDWPDTDQESDFCMILTTGALEQLSLNGTNFILSHEAGHHQHHDPDTGGFVLDDHFEVMMNNFKRHQILTSQEKQADSLGFEFYQDPDEAIICAVEVMNILDQQRLENQIPVDQARSVITDPNQNQDTHGTPDQRMGRIYMYYANKVGVFHKDDPRNNIIAPIVTPFISPPKTPVKK